MAQIKREVAVICMIDSLLNGRFVRAEGWDPSYFSTDFGDISRVNVVGVVVNKENAGGVLVDDGSGRILLRNFEGDIFGGLDLGDLILIIGRPRVYNEQKYILPEIIKKLDPKWGEHRKLQLELIKKTMRPVRRESRVALETETKQVNHFQRIMGFINDLDTGNGAEIGKVIKRANIPNGEELIRKLIEEGEVFELKPGFIKILE
jgi:RPA family protein